MTSYTLATAAAAAQAQAQAQAHSRSRSYATQQFYLPTPPYIPLPVKTTPKQRTPAPSSLAKLAALATLTLLPQHRSQISVVLFARLIHRYLSLVRLPPVITHLTLLYIYRLTKSGFPVHKYTVQQLFVTAFALADIHLDDNAYSNKSWIQVLNDGTEMHEWTMREFDILSNGLQWRLEANDREWAQWCEWVCDWWQRAGASDWERLEAIEAHKQQQQQHNALLKSAPKAAPVVHAPKPVKKTHAATVVSQEIVRAMSVDRMVGWSANAKKRMTQLAECEWDANSVSDNENCDDDDDNEVEVEEEEEEEGYVKDNKTPVLRRKDSGYCEQATIPAASKKPVKKSSFTFKWNFNMF